MDYFIDEICEGAACDPESELLLTAVKTYLRANCKDVSSASGAGKGVCRTKDGRILFTVTPLGTGAMCQPDVEEVILEIHENKPEPPLSSNYLFLMRWQNTQFVPWVALRGEPPLRAANGKVVELPAIEGDSIQRLAQWHPPDQAMVQFYCTSASFHGEFQQSCFTVSAAGAAGDLSFEFSSNAALTALPGDRYLLRELARARPLAPTSGDAKKAGGVQLDAQYTEGILETTSSGNDSRRTLVQEKHSFEIRLIDSHVVASPGVSTRYQ